MNPAMLILLGIALLWLVMTGRAAAMVKAVMG